MPIPHITWEPPIGADALPRPLPDVPRYVGYFAAGQQLYQWDGASLVLYDGLAADYTPTRASAP